MWYGYTIRFVTTYCSSDRRDRGPEMPPLTLAVTKVSKLENTPISKANYLKLHEIILLIGKVYFLVQVC